MSIENLRFRMEGELCVLQVLVLDYDNYYGGRQNADWRDGKATDLLELGEFLNRKREIDNGCRFNWQSPSNPMAAT